MNRIYFDELDIIKYRGLKNVKLSDCSMINLVVGGNNGGKSSLLEAISLFKTDEPRNLLNIASNRTMLSTNVSDFIYLFPFHNHELKVSALINGKKTDYLAKYEINDVLYNDKNVNDASPLLNRIKTGDTFKQFIIDVNFDGAHKKASLSELERFISLSDTKAHEKTFNNPIIYVSPFSHFEISTRDISDVLRYESYKKVFIELLKIFDNRIEDIRILDSQYFSLGERNIYVKMKNEDSVPLSTFGDGIKKAIILSSKVAQARNGVLLLDELETSLHHSYYEDIFAFLFKAAKAYNIQLFITTHNEEVIKSLIEVDKQYFDSDLVRVYTLRKNVDDEIKVRELNGLEAYNYIVDSSIEIRD